ncbi:F0F1 ATP synthase subunit B [Roseovarius nanhaiticus]|uniref:ATP synthase subunit b n=1 Tax=Roseovarius nanhaiticus TaxID=573024 RepID=A0A1N7F0E5_9RHOB|nr:F0F1 ATP synthase subunit B [Roseovarius nanhaiticus]SEK63670.1 F-type H+-transporting ATPase subunit b [Roseovarius nanhaiticus]SIR93744.1 F-type H+-transporting ATPase subunit b [Roseovarius nanhaiticus]
MRMIASLIALFAASPALAASGPFFSLSNSNFVVMIAFILFLAVLAYLKVPGKIGEMLDKRADGIKSELDEARALREEAQALLATYERQQKDVQAQADRIVAQAKTEATEASEQAREDLKKSIARRMQAAEDRIASAEADAVREVRDQAATIAIAAAREVIAKQMSAAEANKLIDDGIETVSAKLH